jgi:hypothetical protein
MYQAYDTTTERNDQLVMLLWLAGAASVLASAMSYGMISFGLI